MLILQINHHRTNGLTDAQFNLRIGFMVDFASQHVFGRATHFSTRTGITHAHTATMCRS